MTLAKAITRFRHLEQADRILVLQALLLLPMLHALFRVVGVRRVMMLVQGFDNPPPNVQTTNANARAQRITQLVRLAGRRGVARGNCLSQSLTLWWLLDHQGIASDLRIGVRKNQGRLQAHAWVERDGIPLNERWDVHTQYAPFDKRIVPQGVRWI